VWGTPLSASPMFTSVTDAGRSDQSSVDDDDVLKRKDQSV